MTPLPASARRRIMSRISDLVPMSTPAVGSSMISTSGSVPSHLAMTTFCWLPPESSRTGRPGCATLTWNLLEQVLGQRLACPVGDERAALQLPEQGQQQILPDGVVQDEALQPAVLRHKGDAVVAGIAGVVQADLLPSDEHLAGADRIDAEQHSGKFGAAAAHQPGQAEDLAFVQGEADIVHPGSGLQVACLEQRGLRHRPIPFLVFKLALDLSTDDALDDLRGRHLVRAAW